MCTSTFVLRGLSSAAARNLSANDIIYLSQPPRSYSYTSIGYYLGLPFRASERACSLHGFVFAISKLRSAAKEETEDWKRKRL